MYLFQLSWAPSWLLVHPNRLGRSLRLWTKGLIRCVTKYAVVILQYTSVFLLTSRSLPTFIGTSLYIIWSNYSLWCTVIQYNELRQPFQRSIYERQVYRIMSQPVLPVWYQFTLSVLLRKYHLLNRLGYRQSLVSSFISTPIALVEQYWFSLILWYYSFNKLI